MRSSGRFGDPTAGIPGRRLFVATPLPDEATQAMAAVVDEVRAAALPDGRPRCALGPDGRTASHASIHRPDA
ncbi:MAG: hypothetical protein WKF78_13930 [Candidatus Limnocylindrales bacterium]